MAGWITTVVLVIAVAAGSCSRQPAIRIVAADESPGVIEGTVIYEDGRPAKGAMVSAFPLDRIMLGRIPATETDAFGHFYIKHLLVGKFDVTAKKESEGYPDSSSRFYYERKIAPITLSLSHLAATDTIILGPRAGILTGTAVDAVTGVPLEPCVDFHWASDPNKFMSGTGLIIAEYRLLIPPDRDVIMKIWCDGYLPWYYPGADSKSAAKPLRLASGEEKKLYIRLRRGTDTSDAGCNTPLCFPHCRP
jgi:hypothetical protein